MEFGVILVKIVELRHQLPAADGAIGWIKCHRHIPRAGVADTGAAGVEDGMGNCVFENQSAKRMSQQDTMMILLIGRPGGQCQFTDGGQATVLSGDR